MVLWLYWQQWKVNDKRSSKYYDEWIGVDTMHKTLWARDEMRFVNNFIFLSLPNRKNWTSFKWHRLKQQQKTTTTTTATTTTTRRTYCKSYSKNPMRIDSAITVHSRYLGTMIPLLLHWILYRCNGNITVSLCQNIVYEQYDLRLEIFVLYVLVQLHMTIWIIGR